MADTPTPRLGHSKQSLQLSKSWFACRPCQKSKQCPNYDDDIDRRKGLSWLWLTLVLQITGFRFDRFLPLDEWRIIRLEMGPSLPPDRDAKANPAIQPRICILHRTNHPRSFQTVVLAGESQLQKGTPGFWHREPSRIATC